VREARGTKQYVDEMADRSPFKQPAASAK